MHEPPPRSPGSEDGDERFLADGIVAAVRHPMLVMDAYYVIRRANSAFHYLFGTNDGATVGQHLFDLEDGPWHTETFRRELGKISANGSGRRMQDYETEYRSKSGGRRVIRVSAISLDFGRAIVLTIEDITDRVLGQQRYALLIAELNHRVKNVLATVQALLSQSVRNATSIEQLEAGLSGRLQALGRGHEILVGNDWQDSRLDQLAQGIMKAFGGASRIVVDCGSLHLRPRATLAFNLILHELATNAQQYGALSVPDGKVYVSCRLVDGQTGTVAVKWQESGGPRVVPPERAGFGMKLIQRSASHELGGEALIDFKKEGIECTILFSLGDEIWMSNEKGY